LPDNEEFEHPEEISISFETENKFMNIGKIEIYSYRSIDHVPFGAGNSIKLSSGSNIY